jgi:hypothetical protein
LLATRCARCLFCAALHSDSTPQQARETATNAAPFRMRPAEDVTPVARAGRFRAKRKSGESEAHEPLARRRPAQPRKSGEVKNRDGWPRRWACRRSAVAADPAYGLQVPWPGRYG